MRTMNEDIREGISGLLWYAECKQLALKMVMTFRPPADGHAMRMYHPLYLTSLLSLLNRADELFGPAVKVSWRRALDGKGGQTGENNSDYLSELRNSLVHRGADITANGIVVQDQTCAIAPPQAFHRLGKKGPHTAFAPLLRNVFAICEDSIGQAILPAANDVLTAEESRSPDDLKTDYIESVGQSLHMPEWAKEMARKHVDQIPFEDLRGFQAIKLRALLGQGAPIGLALAV